MADQPVKKEPYRVALIHETSIGRFRFPSDHPMVALRAVVSMDLIRAAGLLNHLTLVPNDERFPLNCHSQDLVEELDDVAGGPFDGEQGTLDCPILVGCYDYSKAISDASVKGATLLVNGDYDAVINWTGGMHHACYDKAEGYCYINDINEAIHVLLGRFAPVLYVDIDVHHGDGVELYYGDDERVITLSSHYYDGTYYPSTGITIIQGAGQGELTDYEHTSKGALRINVPLHTGLSDEKFSFVMLHIIKNVIKYRSPQAIVLQSGGDSLAGDRLGVFNLTTIGHSCIIAYLRSVPIPLLVLGGGGYNIVNVPRTWAFETAILTSQPLLVWKSALVRSSGSTQRIMNACEGWLVEEERSEDMNNWQRLLDLTSYIENYLIKISFVKKEEEGKRKRSKRDRSGPKKENIEININCIQ